MKTKRLFALALAVLLLLSCAPVFVFAADLPTVQNVRVSGGDGTFYVQWDPVNDFNARKDLYYFNILYSTDKANWAVATNAPRDSAGATVYDPEEGAFVAGTTYYFAVQGVGWNGELGPVSAPTAGVKYTDSTAEKRAEWETLLAGYKSKTTEKGTKYDKVKLVKGEKVVWDNGLYTLSASIKSVSKTKAVVTITMKNKIGKYYTCDFLGWDAVPGKHYETPATFEVIDGSKDVTVYFEDFKDGANFLRFTVHTYGSPISQFRDVAASDDYNAYSYDMLHMNRQHILYFQNAPQAASLTFRGENLSVSSKSFSFGSAYKSSSDTVKSSGSILYYKAAGDKKWSKKTIAAGKPLGVSKLKPNTEYSLRSINYVKSPSAADGKTLITSKSGYSNTLKLRTGLAAAPEIKSVKISSKIVTVHHKAEWRYNGVKWVYTEAYDTKQTNFTATVILKSIPNGMKALQCSGLGALNTQIVDVKKKSATFTFTGTAAASAKGKAINLTFLSYTNKFDNSWYAGYSPSVKKSVTL